MGASLLPCEWTTLKSKRKDISFGDFGLALEVLQARAHAEEALALRRIREVVESKVEGREVTSLAPQAWRTLWA